MTSQLSINGFTKGYPLETPDRGFRDACMWAGTNTNVVVIDWFEVVVNFRNNAVLDRAGLVNAAADDAVITDQEAIEASKGNWIAAFDQAVVELSVKDKRRMKVLWGGLSEVRRDHPLLSLIVAAHLATDKQIDGWFGYKGQYPPS